MAIKYKIKYKIIIMIGYNFLRRTFYIIRGEDLFG